MQSYGIIGVTLWIICGVSAGKRQFPAWKREVNAYNKLFPSWRIGLCKAYTVLQILYLQPICNSICNATTVCQLVYYTRLVAGGRCFYVFSTLW